MGASRLTKQDAPSLQVLGVGVERFPDDPETRGRILERLWLRYVSSQAQRKDRAKKAGNYPGSFIQATDCSWRRKEELEGGDTPFPHR